ncbi:uncharacterized mitochondrial protein AtMg00860-like [Typha angustifolia]|uniref:uncharacterized mitochondrial protein AtMg00860-like n=1 Tax=Typha angustifolia TaxID=59011 RepID=UPI003C2E404D
MEILQAHWLKMKKSKCLWGQLRVDYIGHLISSTGVEVDPMKVASMVCWPLPKMPKELQGRLSWPVLPSLCEDGFEWNEAKQAFEELKQTMLKAPLLALPDFTRTFVVECDASRSRISTILMQEGRSIAYMRKDLSQRSCQSSMYK